jgi:hypothetical protein
MIKPDIPFGIVAALIVGTVLTPLLCQYFPIWAVFLVEAGLLIATIIGNTLLWDKRHPSSCEELKVKDGKN